MRANFTAANPSQIEFTLSLTMPLGDWMTLRDQIGPASTWPSSDLSSAIFNMVMQAHHKFEPTGEA